MPKNSIIRFALAALTLSLPSVMAGQSIVLIALLLTGPPAGETYQICGYNASDQETTVGLRFIPSRGSADSVALGPPALLLNAGEVACVDFTPVSAGMLALTKPQNGGARGVFLQVLAVRADGQRRAATGVVMVGAHLDSVNAGPGI